MRTPTMPRVPTGFGALPPELGGAIFEKVITSTAEEARQDNSALTPEQAATASARALARLPAVSKAFQEWRESILDAHPDVAMASTRNAILDMAGKLDDEEFGRGIGRLLAHNTHIHIAALPPSKLRIILQKLANHTDTPLQQVTLNLSHPLMRGLNPLGTAALADMVNAVADMNQNNPGLQIAVNLSNRSLGRESAMSVAALLRNGVTSLNLSRNQLRGDSLALIARVLPYSRVTSLDLSGNAIGDEGLRVIAKEVPRSKVIDLNLGINFIFHAGPLIDALHDCGMRSLNLQANRLGPEAGMALGRVLPECGLRSLDVSLNAFNAEGVQPILDALSRSGVTRVNLMGTIMLPADDALVRAIGDALLRSEVTDMDLTNNNLSTQDEQAIDTAHLEAQRQRAKQINVWTGFVMR